MIKATSHYPEVKTIVTDPDRFYDIATSFEGGLHYDVYYCNRNDVDTNIMIGTYGSEQDATWAVWEHMAENSAL